MSWNDFFDAFVLRGGVTVCGAPLWRRSFCWPFHLISLRCWVMIIFIFTRVNLWWFHWDFKVSFLFSTSFVEAFLQLNDLQVICWLDELNVNEAYASNFIIWTNDKIMMIIIIIMIQIMIIIIIIIIIIIRADPCLRCPAFMLASWEDESSGDVWRAPVMVELQWRGVARSRQYEKVTTMTCWLVGVIN